MFCPHDYCPCSACSAPTQALTAHGQAPQDLKPWLCGASLVALPKQPGDLRPVAVGDTWRRLTSKLLARSLADDLKPILEPVQVWVGTKGGAEANVHVAPQWLHRYRSDKNKLLVTLDLKNTFNCVSRCAVLTAVRRVCPGVVPWVDLQLLKKK